MLISIKRKQYMALSVINSILNNIEYVANSVELPFYCIIFILLPRFAKRN